jgi:4-hydroxythreonine-4-phosphate dehydrogenase
MAADPRQSRISLPVAVTMGEPAGIGGEIVLKAWGQRTAGSPVFFAIDDPARLDRIAARFALKCPIVPIAQPGEAAAAFARGLPVLALPEPLGGTALRETILGKPDPATGRAVVASIDRAVELVRAGAASALVTNPIQKATIQAAGFKFPGHTEYLGHLAGATPAMMLAVEGLRVVPVTVHVPVRDVAAALTTAAIVTQGRITAAALRRDFGVTAPRLAVAALNPHAGEAGKIGDEEIRIIAPAVAQLQAEGIAAQGPTPADTLFHPGARRTYDAVICMYHDQALIPLKTIDFWGGVNVTLGLPFVRCSPDHGTALDIADRGIADPTSLMAAIAMARTIRDHRDAAAA